MRKYPRSVALNDRDISLSYCEPLACHKELVLGFIVLTTLYITPGSLPAWEVLFKKLDKDHMSRCICGYDLKAKCGHTDVQDLHSRLFNSVNPMESNWISHVFCH
jgi:hypothetical protein